MRKGLLSFAVNFVLVGVIALLYLITALPYTDAVPTLGTAVYKGSEDSKVALQWVVSWSARSLEEILNILKDSNVKATFIVSGEWVNNNQAMLIRMVAEGHEIGTCGMRPNQDGNLSWVSADVIESIGVIEEAGGVSPRLYYSGDRKQSVSSRASRQLGLTHVVCTVDLLCSRGGADDIMERLDNVAGGSIVLMQPTTQAAEALLDLIAELKRRGLTPVSTGELIGI